MQAYWKDMARAEITPGFTSICHAKLATLASHTAGPEVVPLSRARGKPLIFSAKLQLTRRSLSPLHDREVHKDHKALGGKVSSYHVLTCASMSSRTVKDGT